MMNFKIAERIEGRPGAPVFFFCDHASNAVPASYDGLGLASDMLATHIGWDIGARALTLSLAQRFDAPALLCGYSRLLIDPNRSLDRQDLIPEVSDSVPIPGNRQLPPGERRKRIQQFFEPYHERLAYELDQFCAGARDPLALSIHSYARRLSSEAQDRPWDVGVLWKNDEATANGLIARLTALNDFRVGDNQPYDARVFNYSIDRHVAPRGIRHLTLEIRQDLIEDTGGVRDMARVLADALERFAV